MVRKITVDVPTHASSFEAHQRPVTVSLPAPPFDFTVTYNDRPETRPRSVPIRAEKLTWIDRKWLKSMARGS